MTMHQYAVSLTLHSLSLSQLITVVNQYNYEHAFPLSTRAAAALSLPLILSHSIVDRDLMPLAAIITVIPLVLDRVFGAILVGLLSLLRYRYVGKQQGTCICLW